jgi:hypothetical protein
VRSSGIVNRNAVDGLLMNDEEVLPILGGRVPAPEMRQFLTHSLQVNLLINTE